MSGWTHNGLLRDLADSRRKQGKIVWRDQNIGQAGSPRPDVIAVNKSYAKWAPEVYEVKVTRADFLSDIKSGKWQSYCGIAATIAFAVPAGLVKKTEIPDGVGLIVRHETVWRYVKKPTVQKIDQWPHDVWMALLMDLEWRRYMAGHRPRRAEFTKAAQERHVLGDDIREYLDDRDALRRRLKRDSLNADERAERLRKRADSIIEHARIEADALKNEAALFRKELEERGHPVPGDRFWSDRDRVKEWVSRIERACDGDARLEGAEKAVAQALGALRGERVRPA